MPDGRLLEDVIRIARAAGDEVLAVYGRNLRVTTKGDGSPVTEADRRAHVVICAELSRLDPALPIVSEEDGERAVSPDADERAGHPLPADGRFWLVDPLDGTKELLSRNGQFTVNIALIDRGTPVLGVVVAPALERVFAAEGGVAVVRDGDGQRQLTARAVPAEGATVVSSRSHGDPEALARFESEHRVAASVTAGSSLKFCLLAEGLADLYPRFGRTMEWDTAAGDAVLRTAGGSVTDLDGRPLRYGKPGYENPHFLARGRG